jgi:hypothetical protein
MNRVGSLAEGFRGRLTASVNACSRSNEVERSYLLRSSDDI